MRWLYYCGCATATVGVQIEKEVGVTAASKAQKIPESVDNNNNNNSTSKTGEIRQPTSTDGKTMYDGQRTGNANTNGGSRKKKLIKAAKNGNVDKVEAALREDPGCLNALAMWGNSALIYACQYGHEQVACLLIDKGADVTVVNEEKCTALHHACLEGMDDTVRKLLPMVRDEKLSLGPGMIYNSNTDTKTELTPFVAACINGHHIIAKLLLERNLVHDRDLEIQQALAGSIANQRVDSVKALLSLENDICHQLLTDDIAYLRMACSNLNLVTMLLDNGCKVNGCLCSPSQTVNNECPLALAAKDGNYELTKLLLDHGADVNYTCGLCSLPILQACRSEDMDTIQTLKEGGANLALTDPLSGMSAQEFCENANIEL